MAHASWGTGWPHCQDGRMVTITTRSGVRITVRAEVAQLVKTLCDATILRGYHLLAGQTWGYACRRIRGSSRPSEHSWGLAVDINSLANPMGAPLRTNIPTSVVQMWEQCGFRWGGRWTVRPDPMHFEYAGAVRDVPRHLAIARDYLHSYDREFDVHAFVDAAMVWEARQDGQVGHWFVKADGAIFAAGVPYFGGANPLPPGWEAVSIERFGGRVDDGYCIAVVDPTEHFHTYVFTRATWEEAQATT